MEELSIDKVLNDYLNFQKSLIGFETKRKYGFKSRKFKKYVKKPDPLLAILPFRFVNKCLFNMIERRKQNEIV